MKEVKLFNICIDNITTDKLLEELGKRGGIVFTPNVDHLMRLQKDQEFYDIYHKSDYRVCDSQIVYYASRLLNQPITEKISGSDLFPAFYNYYRDCEAITIFLLGAAEGVAARAKVKINEKVGREMVVDCYSPPFGFEKDELECQRIVDRINHSKASVLAIGVGAPKQEKWIMKHKDKLTHAKIFLAIGATIDFEAGEKPRSPEWISEAGLEWLHRLVSEPQRLWKRYLIEDMPFFLLLMQQKLNLYHSPFNSLGGMPIPNWQMPLLGQILQDAGLLDALQVQRVLTIQDQKQNLRFGEIVTDLGWLHQETVDFFAEQLPQIGENQQRQPLGYYLKQAMLLDDEQINLILLEQQQKHLRFGELAVQKRWLKQQTVDSILSYLTQSQTEMLL
ncbi:MAG: WecB/TagA/CpsF family glycosyltransferase [Arthrospira sp. SH-MAG29]|nr:WecB/TagA/CpsF family glycosyltransferase [Arthrospira sp. SH-MAG29]MBS0017546.1 WecB/TagA/CpsF family glycosyltransferase [Arthrospira sp. SH-MAG29]